MSPAGLRQPDQRTCGAACVVVASGPPYDPGTFGATALATHRRLTRARLRGRWQLPWPRALGTPPWAVARELTATTGVRHRVRVLRTSGAVPRRPGVLYVGSRWLPRHVVLVLDQGCYEPSSGRVLDLDPTTLSRGGRAVAGWRWPWFAVAPRD